MTPKQEREWASQIYDRVKEFDHGSMLQSYAEFRGLLKSLAEGDKYVDKAFARKVADLFESIAWLEDYRKDIITKDEFNEKLMNKGRLAAEKDHAAFMRRLENKYNPKPKPRKKKGKVK